METDVKEVKKDVNRRFDELASDVMNIKGNASKIERSSFHGRVDIEKH